MSTANCVRVLIAEDDPITAEMIRVQLVGRGHTVVGSVTSGSEAVAATRTLQPDVIIMDVEMPDLDGIEATRQIYAECPTPVVILTSHEDEDSIGRASAAGAGAYLLKPPRGDEIERALIMATALFKDLMELGERNQEIDSCAHTVAQVL